MFIYFWIRRVFYQKHWTPYSEYYCFLNYFIVDLYIILFNLYYVCNYNYNLFDFLIHVGECDELYCSVKHKNFNPNAAACHMVSSWLFYIWLLKNFNQTQRSFSRICDSAVKHMKKPSYNKNLTKIENFHVAGENTSYDYKGRQ